MQALVFGVQGETGVPQSPGFVFKRPRIGVGGHKAAGSGLGACWSRTSVDAPADRIRVQSVDVFIGRTANQVIRTVASNFCNPGVKWRGTGQGPMERRGRCHRQHSETRVRAVTERQGEDNTQIKRVECGDFTPVIAALRRLKQNCEFEAWDRARP